MAFIVFSFRPVYTFDLNWIAKAAYRFLDGTCVVVEESGCQWYSSRVRGEGKDEFGTVKGFERPFNTIYRIASRNQGWEAVYRVTPREITPEDKEAAKAAEAKGGKPGLAAIAEKCQTIYDVEEMLLDPKEFPKLELPYHPLAELSMGGLLSAVGLGPVLFKDGTLFDAKSVWEKVAEVVKASAA